MGTSRAYPHNSSIKAFDAIGELPGHCAQGGFPCFDAISQAGIEAQWIIPENLSLNFVSDIFSVDQVRDVVAEIALVALVRVVRSPDQRILVGHLRGKG